MNLITLSLLITGVAQLGAAPVLTLPGGGNLYGAPGEQAGWGFTLTNDADFLVPTSAVFCESSYGGNCTQVSGVFSDFIASFQFLVIGPGQTLTQTFDAGALTGLGAFQIHPAATPGTIESGVIYVTYDRYDCDLNDARCGNPIQTAFSELISAPAAVYVTEGEVPEPAAFALAGLGLTLLLITRWSQV